MKATANAPLRRADGTLVSAVGFVDVERTQLADARPASSFWRGIRGAKPVGGKSGQGGPSQSNDLNDTSGFGRAWWNTGEDIPRVGGAGRSLVIRTDSDLQLGPEPGRIARINDARIGGLVGPDIQNSFPPDANMGYLRHQQIGKLTQGATPSLRTIADDAWLPGVFAGNPVG